MCLRITNISFVIFWPIPCVMAPICLLPYIWYMPQIPMTDLLAWKQLLVVLIITLSFLAISALIPILRLYISTRHYRLSPLRGGYGVQWRSQHSCCCWWLPLLLSQGRIWKYSWQPFACEQEQHWLLSHHASTCACNTLYYFPCLSPAHVYRPMCSRNGCDMTYFDKHLLPTSLQHQCIICEICTATPAFHAVWRCIFLGRFIPWSWLEGIDPYPLDRI